ncbi:Uncharacterised protein [Vibrio cholerae]|nr:Uncharacterised protein [Vibrio cholerae]CSB05220.1 Uncharacterised protein [Vibrio cholerae]CSB79315.1 Uncharacterised protein [Vibrio cholerae]
MALSNRKCLRPDTRMLFHDGELLIGQFARFEQNRIGNANLAYIMQWRGFVE